MISQEVKVTKYRYGVRGFQCLKCVTEQMGREGSGECCCDEQQAWKKWSILVLLGTHTFDYEARTEKAVRKNSCSMYEIDKVILQVNKKCPTGTVSKNVGRDKD